MTARRTRLARWIVAVVTAALTLTLLAVPPAYAGWSDSGPGGSDKGSGHSGKQRTGDFHCGNWISGGNPGALYYQLRGTWYRWWEYGYQPCVGEGTSDRWLNTGLQELVPTGFLVYRFYGSYNNPTAAVTRSRTNLTRWAKSESTYAFPAANPMDAGHSVGSPWAAKKGTNRDQKNNGSPDYTYMRNDAGLLVPSKPVQVKGQCSSLQTGHKLRDWFNHEASKTEQIALRAALGRDYWVASGGGKYPQTGMAEAGIRGIKDGYRFNWNAWRKDPTKEPKYDKSGNAYYLRKFVWEDRACASPFNFMSDTETSAGNRTVIGTCYIPLMRKRIQVRDVRTGKTDWKWSTLQHDWNRTGYGDGERLSNYYKGTSYTPGGKGGDGLDRSVTGLSERAQKQLINSWRRAMAEDYRKWAGKGYTNRSGAQIVPANPYVGEGNRNLIPIATHTDVDKGAKALREAARCRVGSAVQFDVPEPAKTAPAKASVNLRVTNHDVLQVSPTKVQIKVTPERMLCSGSGCPSGVDLKSLSWSGALTGVGGYKLCKVTSSSLPIKPGCDGAYTVSTSSRDGIQRSQVFTVRFAHPTDPREAVRVSLTNLKGTYTQTTTTKGLQIRGVSPITGERYTVDTGALHASTTRDLSVTASGAPKKLTKVSGGYRVDAPVVGAVQVPVSR